MSNKEGGIKLSRQAQAIVHQAKKIGIDPSSVIQVATETAQAEGRTKIGMFGSSGNRLEYLRDVLRSMEQQKAVEKILGKDREG